MDEAPRVATDSRGAPPLASASRPSPAREPRGAGGDGSGRLVADGGEAWVDELRETLSGLLGRGPRRIQDLATARGVSVRTLQRHLARVGLTYLALVDEFRLAEARRFLTQPGALLKGVAANLGFREPASFTRACRRWTGLTPREFQRRLRASGGERASPGLSGR